MDRTRLQDFRKLLNNLFESGKCYRIEEAMEHINFAKAEISLWMIIDEVPDGRIKKGPASSLAEEMMESEAKVKNEMLMESINMTRKQP